MNAATAASVSAFTTETLRLVSASRAARCHPPKAALEGSYERAPTIRFPSGLIGNLTMHQDMSAGSGASEPWSTPGLPAVTSTRPQFASAGPSEAAVLGAVLRCDCRLLGHARALTARAGRPPTRLPKATSRRRPTPLQRRQRLAWPRPSRLHAPSLGEERSVRRLAACSR